MKVVVIGAGVAGVAAAHTLRKQGLDPVVLEASDAVGGRTRTVTRDGYALDSGAIFVMGSYAATLRYLRESGHLDELSRWAAHTRIQDETGAKHPVRFDRPWTLATMPQLTWKDRAVMAARIGALALRRGPRPFDLDDLAAADDGRTLAEWATATFGERGYEYAVRPLMSPLTGADPTEISSAFTIALMHRVHRTQLTVPPGGLGRIAAWLAEGADVRLSTPAQSLRSDPTGVIVETPSGPLEADAAIVATDVRTTRSLLHDVAPASVIEALGAVVPIPAYHVLLGYHRDPWPTTDHDLVVQARRGAHPDYGVLLNSRRSPGSVPTGGQTVSVYFDHAQAPDPDQVLPLAIAAVERAFGKAEPDFHEVFSSDVSLIAPTPGHYKAMQRARDTMPGHVRLAGDYLTHSGIEGALLSGQRAARDLLASRNSVLTN